MCEARWPHNHSSQLSVWVLSAPAAGVGSAKLCLIPTDESLFPFFYCEEQQFGDPGLVFSQ